MLVSVAVCSADLAVGYHQNWREKNACVPRDHACKINVKKNVCPMRLERVNLNLCGYNNGLSYRIARFTCSFSPFLHLRVNCLLQLQLRSRWEAWVLAHEPPLQRDRTIGSDCERLRVVGHTQSSRQPCLGLAPPRPPRCHRPKRPSFARRPHLG